MPDHNPQTGLTCATCFGTSFTSTDDGKLCCADCGQEVYGFQHEEMDDALIGTAMSNRQSQASQALAARATLQAKSESAIKTTPVVSVLPDDLLICEGVFIYLSALVDRLVYLQYATSRIRSPLFCIARHWVRRCRSGVPPFSKMRRIFRPHHALAMVCLAAVYIRLPLLPRDICRLVATRQLPFLTTLTSVFPKSFRITHAVRDAFVPTVLPIAAYVIRAARIFATDPHAWPPMRALFTASASPSVSQRNLVEELDDDHSSHHNHPRSDSPSVLPGPAFPVGHLHITLLRVTRLLGLPDLFGARVLRWIDLRRHAEAWHYDRSYASTAVWPTDESLIADVVNTMRLCYGRRRRSECDTPQLVREWEQCKSVLLKWLRRGAAEDLDTVLWTGLSHDVLKSLRGRRLRRYVALVDDFLKARGETIPDLWGPIERDFQTMADMADDEGDEGDEDDEDASDSEEDDGMEHVRREHKCMYDEERCRDADDVELNEGLEEMELECGYDPKTGCVVRRPPLLTPGKDYFLRRRKRKRTENSGEDPEAADNAPPSAGSESDESGKKRLREAAEDKGDRSRSCRMMWEPAGIGVAWTALIHFFDGSNVEVMGMEWYDGPTSKLERVRARCDRSMKVAVRYLEANRSLGCESRRK